MSAVDFARPGSWSSRRHETKRIVRSGSRIDWRFANQAQAVGVNFTDFSLVIPKDCQIREMITEFARKEAIYPSYVTDCCPSGRRIDQLLQSFGQFRADVFVLPTGLDDALGFPAL